MEMFNELSVWFENNPVAYATAKVAGVLFLAFLAYIVAKKLIVTSIRKIVTRSKTSYDDILLNEKLLTTFAYIAPLLILNQFTDQIPKGGILLSNMLSAVVALLVLLALNNILSGVNEIYERATEHKKRPIKGYIQVIKIILFVIGGILIIGILTGQEIFELLAGLGALTAVLLLIFKDTILSFVASIQITSYDLVKVGDWIEVPSFGVDGDVMDISLHTIKVRNFDKTITTIPTHKLIEVSFKNWRGMVETGGRRIKRSIYIDLSSVKFLDDNDILRLSRIDLLKNYLSSKQKELGTEDGNSDDDNSVSVNKRRLTNVGTFRAYLKEYLRSRSDIHKGLTFLIRQLSPGPTGLPIEIYVFTTTTDWIKYEEIQADIFDFLFAAIREFDLKTFQSPSGEDVKSLITETK